MGINDLKCCLQYFQYFRREHLVFLQFPKFVDTPPSLKVKDLNIIPQYSMNDGESNHDNKESSINDQRRV